MIYLCHYNYDYDESEFAFASRAEAVAHIALSFEIDEDVTHDTPEFWDAVRDNYAADDWKGLTFKILDPATLRITDAPDCHGAN